MQGRSRGARRVRRGVLQDAPPARSAASTGACPRKALSLTTPTATPKAIPGVEPAPTAWAQLDTAPYTSRGGYNGGDSLVSGQDDPRLLRWASRPLAATTSSRGESHSLAVLLIPCAPHQTLPQRHRAQSSHSVGGFQETRRSWQGVGSDGISSGERPCVEALGVDLRNRPPQEGRAVALPWRRVPRLVHPRHPANIIPGCQCLEPGRSLNRPRASRQGSPV